MTARAKDQVTTIGELGELGLIDQLVARLGAPRSDTILGAGPDDTAVLALPSGGMQLATIDTQIEGSHFRRETVSARNVGRKLAAVNLSDIAAMGGTPTHALATLSAPEDLDADWALGLVDGIVDELARWGADLVGGNVARHDGLVIDLALLGEVDEDRLLLRSGAKSGDVLMVTGNLGAAAAGLALLAAEQVEGRDAPSVAMSQRESVLARLHAPEPRLQVGCKLRQLGATACLDVSDGLASDARHLCKQSHVGVRVAAAALPISDATRAVARVLGVDPLSWAVGGGEDYELVFTASADRADELALTVSRETGVNVTTIGTVITEHVRVLMLPDGSETALEGGWQHFGEPVRHDPPQR